MRSAGGKGACRKSVAGKGFWRKVSEVSQALGDFLKITHLGLGMHFFYKNNFMRTRGSFLLKI